MSGWAVPALMIFLAVAPAAAHELDSRMHHLRVGPIREWSEFPEHAEASQLKLSFRAEPNASPATLRLRQQDVKEQWRVLLNGHELGRLCQDENDMVVYMSVPAGTLVAGDNTLVVRQIGPVPDDIRVGQIILDDRPIDRVLSEGAADITVSDADSGESLPCRLTVLNADGALVTTGATSGGHLAVRAGVIYTGDGHANFGLPAGDYTISAGRGFEYGLASTKISLRPGDRIARRLAIRREVSLPQYVSCDTHIHTLTHSGHGDASVDERMITLAGEGIELPVATDHNVQVDYGPAVSRLGLGRWFTPVVGNEVTTDIGHFCIFPVPASGAVPNYKLRTWDAIFDSIETRTHAPVVILNHPCDVHAGFRPFAPAHFNAVTGENLDGWSLRANGIEVINSGAMQSDPMLPFRGWFALMNHGTFLTPVGASDSHDVSRFIVGQARTYIRTKRHDPSNIDVSDAVANFRAGRVMVSCGLAAEIIVNDKYEAGDLVPAADPVSVVVRVLGPSWVTADRVALYANGEMIRDENIRDGTRPGLKYSARWTLPAFRHDVYLVAIATGPGVRELYWPIAKPFQPASPQVNRRMIGSSGAVWIDADGDGQRTCACEYARRIIAKTGANPIESARALRDYDRATAAQAAGLLHQRGKSVDDAAVLCAAREAGAQVEQGFRAFIDELRANRPAQSIESETR